MATVLRILLCITVGFLLSPAAQAQEGVMASVDLEVPLMDKKVEQVPDSLDPAGNPCRTAQEMITDHEPQGSFRFAERSNEWGCARVSFIIDAPPAPTATLRFIATRDIESALLEGATADPRFRQELTILQGEEVLIEADVFDEEDPSITDLARQFTIAHRDNTSLTFWFDFVDLGTTRSQPLPQPSASASMTGDIVRPYLAVSGVPLTPIETQRGSMEGGATWAARFAVPDQVSALHFTIPKGHDWTGLVDEQGNTPVFTASSERITIVDPGPGTYTFSTYQAVATPPVTTPATPWALVLGTLAVVGGAGFSTGRFVRLAHPTQMTHRRWSIVAMASLGSLWAAGSLLLAMQGGDPLNTVPLGPGGYWWLAAASTLVLLACFQIVDSVQSIRRAQHLHHEDELESYIQRLARSNKDLEAFAYVASHDLQAPLRRIRGFLELLDRRHGAGLAPDGKEYLDRSVENSVHLQALISDLLSFSRLDQRMGTRTRLSVHDAIAAALTEHEDRMLEAKVDLHFSPTMSVIGSPALMREMFSNLIDNAVQYQDPDRTLRLKIHAKARSGSLHVDVSDNGRGIPKNAQGRVFELFSRADASTGGTGIGLAACRRIAELHEGSLDLLRSSDDGSSFRLILPLAPAEATPERGLSPVRALRPLARPTPTN